MLKTLGEQLRAKPPRFIVTCARGSSDHAAAYAKYVFETRLGLITASASPSISSIYDADLNLEGALFVAISQSGKSPDLLRSAQAAKDAGAQVLALVNVEDSPLAELAHTVIPLRAGPELSVAATKSYLATLAAILQLTAHWSNDAALHAAVARLPDDLRRGWDADWSALTDGLRDARNLFVVGRGYGFGAALEAALKLKETCGLHAEAFSAAEVKHGPMALVGDGFPVLFFAQDDGTLEQHLGRGARIPRARRPRVAGCTGQHRTRHAAAAHRYRAYRGAAAGGAEFLSRRQCVVAGARLRSRRPAASAQGHGDDVMTTPQPLIALINGRVLADHGPQDGLAVLVRGGHIEAMTHADDPRVAGAKRHDLKGRLLLPGFIDVQVNGGGGVLFNAEPTVEALRTHQCGAPQVRHHRLPADADHRRPPTSCTRRSRRSMRRSSEGVPGVLGIHLEGPFLATARKGIHDATLFPPAGCER